MNPILIPDPFLNAFTDQIVNFLDPFINNSDLSIENVNMIY